MRYGHAERARVIRAGHLTGAVIQGVVIGAVLGWALSTLVTGAMSLAQWLGR